MIFSNSSFCQQFSLKELLQMVSNKTLFEQNMIKLGNHPTSIYKNITYEYKKRGDSANVVYVELDKYFKLNPLMTDVTKSSVFASSFAENYNLDDSTASTFYKFYQIKINGQQTINVSQLAKGMYIYEARDKNGVVKQGKLVKD